MTTVHSVKDVKEIKLSQKVAIAAILLLPFVGLFCLLLPAYAEEALPWLLGVPMVLSGAGSIVAVARERNLEAGETSVGAAIVLVVLGLVTVVHGANSTTFIGIIWGLLGLEKGAGEFDDIIGSIKAKEPFLLSLAICVFELVLAVLLILNPFANIEHHLLLLGVELIIYPFKLHREQGRLRLEAEA
ncbi:DUF308 domain-containing protein [Arabiibacter massiliensis]|uniref:DUF308 domain-containing protein n=1 Tax=Arabiibacter massiliensis TaxID=1870985 RepID=UPI0009BA89D6|nr:DUF308 domain-containing protein [Arabiibacter massiliensis]